MNNKKELGQFYTNNYEKILKNISITDIKINYKKIIEPFVGQGDLIPYIQNFKKSDTKIEYYDIEPKVKTENIIKQDTLLDPPDYKDSIIITNPPYLAKNKTKNKNIYEKYDENDLYKCFIKSIINKVNGGVLLIPLNFFCNIRKLDLKLRDIFLSKYRIPKINIFEEKVFDDTGYTICSFPFYKENLTNNEIKIQEIELNFYPSEKKVNIIIKKSENWIIGYNIYNTEIDTCIKIKRLLEGDITSNKSNILLRSIDSGSKKEQKIRLEIVNELYYGKQSSRNLASICWNLNFNLDQQKEICQLFNNFINNNRKKYNSLFLTNYRENSRKRISFELAFRLINTAILIYCKNKKIKLSSVLIN